ncbi:hypothetical protein [Oricola indica]|uniref:hypothetical protein n=1 Tax=Oricola indica TaxID=2872591 RepID=UPI003CCC2450
MATISSIETRLQRLERKTDTAKPYAHLTDDELEAQLAELNRKIFETIGEGNPDAGYAIFRDWCDEPIPDSLEDGLNASALLTTGTLVRFETLLQRFLTEHSEG